MDIVMKRTSSADPDFQKLIRELDRDLAARYGEMQLFFDQFNSVEDISNVIVAFEDGEAIGCGAFKRYDLDTCEIKRMFVLKEARGRKIGSNILSALEFWAKETGFERCILETGKNQPEAIRVYERSGYSVMPNYDQYQGVDLSLCMEKKIS
jgi:putative acetyltransferase